MTEEIEIPFGAFDSETMGWTYSIPEGFTAKIEDGKIIVEKKESEDERIRESIVSIINQYARMCEKEGDPCEASLIDDALAYLEKQKEQKHAEIDEYKIIKKHITEDSLSSEVNKRLKECGWYVTDDKPAEWSEDFEDNIRNLLHDKLSGHSEDGSMSWATIIDDKTLKDIVSGIWFYVGKETLKYPNKEIHVPEWSEEDKEMVLFWNMYYEHKVGDWPNKDVVEHLERFGEWLNTRFKSLRPQSHWKPSEEQMKELYAAAQEAPIVKESGNYLYDLYNDLKKLM